MIETLAIRMTRALTPHGPDDNLIQRERGLVPVSDQEETRRCKQKDDRDGTEPHEVPGNDVYHLDKRTRVAERTHEVQS